MASKLNVSVPRKRTLYPPEPLRASRDQQRRTRITNERQDNFPSPLAKNFTNYRMDADPEIIARETPLFAPGRGKPAGSKRTLHLRKPPYDIEG